MKKNILTFFAVLFLSILSMAQNKEKNFAYCKKVIESQRDVSVVTTFEIYEFLSVEEFTKFGTLLFQKSSVYNVSINEKGNQIQVFHLSEVTYEDIKLLVKETEVELNFISTQNVNFGKYIKQ